MHLSPTSSDPEQYLARTGRRPVVHLQHLGVLGPHLLLAHGVWLDDEEIELVLASRTAIAYCPWAYLRLGQGVTRAGRHAEIVERGGRVALGCDSANAGDMADILRAAALAAGIARDTRLDPERFGAHDVFELATIAGAEAIGMADRIGSLEPGKQADIVVHRADGWGWSPSRRCRAPTGVGHGRAIGARRVRGRAGGRPRRALHHDRCRITVARRRRGTGVVARSGPASPCRGAGPTSMPVEWRHQLARSSVGGV